jgi:hypothetical protein
MKFFILMLMTIMITPVYAGECSIKAYVDRYTAWEDKINKSPEVYSISQLNTDGISCMSATLNMRLEVIEKLKNQDLSLTHSIYHHLEVTFDAKNESIKASIK